MKMKIVSFCAAAILFAASGKAQLARLQGGVNLANVSVTDNGRVDKANMLSSFQAGIVGDLHLGSILYLQPGLLFTGKGSKVEKGVEGSNAYVKQTFNPYYIEVPVNLVLKVPLGTTNHVFAGAGPYLGIGVTGK